MCRVHGLPGFSYGQPYVLQMRLYIHHCIIRYGAILHGRRARPLPQPTAYVGQGTLEEPFELETEINCQKATSTDDIITLFDNDGAASAVFRITAIVPAATHHREESNTRKRSSDTMDESDDEGMSSISALPQCTATANPKVLHQIL